MKVISQSAALYRAAVRDLNSTLHDPPERAEVRALIAELLGRQVRIRQDGAASGDRRGRVIGLGRKVIGNQGLPIW